MRQYRRQQAGKSAFDVGAAQGIHMHGAGIFGVDQAGFAQHLEMMGYGGFWASAIQFAAGRSLDAGQMAHDVQAYGIAQGVQDAFE